MAAPFRLSMPSFEPVLGLTDRPAAAIRAALHLLAPDNRFAHNGRGPTDWDDLGFVRACVQYAMDWDPERQALDPIRPLGDLSIKVSDIPHTQLGHSPNALHQLFVSWGLHKMDYKAARAGDVMLCAVARSGEGGCSIMVRPRLGENGDDFDTIAVVPMDHPPRLNRSWGRGYCPIAAYAWPGI